MSFAELRDLLHVAAVNRAQECVADAAYNHAKVTLPPGPISGCFLSCHAACCLATAHSSLFPCTLGQGLGATNHRQCHCRLSCPFSRVQVDRWVQAATVCKTCTMRSTRSPCGAVSVAIMQQSGAGMSAFTSAVGSDADGTVTAAYETPHVVVLVNVYGAGSG